MIPRKLKFALFGNTYQANKSASVDKILSILLGRGAEVSVERSFYDFLVAAGRISGNGLRVFDGDDFSADFVVSMGGDGTLLSTAGLVGDKGIPVVGVNTGRLGFLADVSPEDLELAIDALYRGDYEVERHSVISVEADGRRMPCGGRALNDIAVLKRDNASMITIRVSVDGESLATYQADGLIVSTPTGSTAYSLSNGGPIIAPRTGVTCLTPVAPHSLSIRPIVIPDDSEVELTVESRSHNFLIAVDGQSEGCDDSARLTIRKAPYEIRIVKRGGRSYFATLREKMMWGVDSRG